MPNNLDLCRPRHLHFIGIGGISMSALALILLARGWPVSGSDLRASTRTERLHKKGAQIYIGHHPSQIDKACGIIYTSAIPRDNPELQAAQAQNIPIFTRAQLLGALMAEARCGIAVAGAHGKTTTTAMIGLMLSAAELEPTVLVGGDLEAIQGNVKIGNGGYFVAEACEYYNNFLNLRPQIGVITNIDLDHLDYFRDLEAIKEAFRGFARLIPPTGCLVATHDDRQVQDITKDLLCPVTTFGFRPGAHWQASDIELLPGGSSFMLIEKGRPRGKLLLQVPGEHNIQNALATIATGVAAGLELKTIMANFSQYRGLHRRFEHRGEYKGATIYDDYAHHPSEIKAALAAARTFRPRRVVALFQPHTYSRTKALLDSFASAFNKADLVLLADIYAAREANTLGVSSVDLALAMRKYHADSYYAGSLENAVLYLRQKLRPGDLLLTMGAGDVHRVADLLTAPSISLAR